MGALLWGSAQPGRPMWRAHGSSSGTSGFNKRLENIFLKRSFFKKGTKWYTEVVRTGVFCRTTIPYYLVPANGPNHVHFGHFDHFWTAFFEEIPKIVVPRRSGECAKSRKIGKTNRGIENLVNKKTK